ncbi:hypothetical protein DITRI_Ditri14bG0011600 [Diplodiscus trichospermus]
MNDAHFPHPPPIKERRFERQNVFLGYCPNGSSLDCRANLFSIFVDNLSHRVSKRALWEAFGEYGRVMDVYTPSSFRGSRAKKTTFACVRYKFRSEMLKAIRFENKRRIDGWRIRMKQTSYGGKDRRFSRHNLAHFLWDKEVRELTTNEGTTVLKDNKSYRDVVLGEDKIAMRDIGERVLDQSKRKEKLIHGNTLQIANESVVKQRLNEVNFDIEIPKNEMEWLFRSAISQLRVISKMDKIYDYMVGAGVKCQISLLGGVITLLTFDTKEGMANTLIESKLLLVEWFEDLRPWENSIAQRMMAV